MSKTFKQSASGRFASLATALHIDTTPPPPGESATIETPGSPSTPRTRAARSKIFAVPSNIKKLVSPHGVREETNTQNNAAKTLSPFLDTVSGGRIYHRRKSCPLLAARIRNLTFDDIIGNGDTLEFLFEFANKTNNAESLELWFELEKYGALQAKAMRVLGVNGINAMVTPREKAIYIWKTFLQNDAPRWVCLDAKTYSDINEKIKYACSAQGSFDTELFEGVIRYVERDIKGDMCLRFKLKYREQLFGVDTLWENEESASKSKATVMAASLTKLHSPFLHAVPKHLMNDHDVEVMMTAAQHADVTLEHVLENEQMCELFEGVAASVEGMGSTLELLKEINDFEREENPRKNTANSIYAKWIVGMFIAPNAAQRVTCVDIKLAQRVQETITKVPDSLSWNLFWSIKQVVKKWLYVGVFRSFVAQHGEKCQEIMKAEHSKLNRAKFMLHNSLHVNPKGHPEHRNRTSSTDSTSIRGKSLGTLMLKDILGNVVEYKGHMHELLVFEARYLELTGRFYSTGQTVKITNKNQNSENHDTATITLLKYIKQFEAVAKNFPGGFDASNAALYSEDVKRVSCSKDMLDCYALANKVYTTLVTKGAGFAIRSNVRAHIDAVFMCERPNACYPEMFFKLKMELLSHIVLMVEPESHRSPISSSARASILSLSKSMSSVLRREVPNTAEVEKVLTLEHFLEMPDALDALSDFARVKNMDEGLFLIDALEEYSIHESSSLLQATAQQIWDMYLVDNSPMWVCADSRTLQQIKASLEAGADAHTFSELKVKVMKDLNCDLVSRFRSTNPELCSHYAQMYKHRNDTRKRSFINPLTAMGRRFSSNFWSRPKSTEGDKKPKNKLSAERKIRTTSFILENGGEKAYPGVSALF